LIPELNAGQLWHEIRARYLIDAVALNKIQGQPFLTSEIEAKIEEVLKQAKEEARQKEFSKLAKEWEALGLSDKEKTSRYGAWLRKTYTEEELTEGMEEELDRILRGEKPSEDIEKILAELTADSNY